MGLRVKRTECGGCRKRTSQSEWGSNRQDQKRDADKQRRAAGKRMVRAILEEWD